jgi:hypothetical protein
MTHAKASIPGPLLIATGLAFGSLILIPALAAQLGMSSTLTGAIRIALMRASFRTVPARSKTDEEPVPTDICCH